MSALRISRRLLLGVTIAALVATPVLASAADGARYLFAPSFSSNRISVFDLDTQTLAASIPAEARGPCCAHVTPDRRKVFVVDGQSPHVTEIDVASLRVTRTIKLRGTWGDRGAPIQRDGGMFWVSILPEGHLQGIDTATGKVVRDFSFISNTFTVSRDGRSLYTANVTSLPTVFAVTATTFAVRSPETGRVLGTAVLPLTTDPAPLQMYASFDDSKVYVQVFGPSGAVHVVDVRDRTRPRYVKTFHVGSVPIVASWNDDGSRLWFPNSGDGTVTVVDTLLDEPIHTIEVGPYVAGVSVLHDRAYVSVSPGGLPPTAPTSMVLLFAGLMPGANLTPISGSGTYRPLIEMPGEVRVYDAITFEALALPALQLPSASHVMEAFDTAR